VIRVLSRNGFIRARAKGGSHQAYKKQESARQRTVIVIEGRKEIGRKTLERIIDRAGKSEDEFLTVLRS